MASEWAGTSGGNADPSSTYARTGQGPVDILVLEPPSQSQAPSSQLVTQQLSNQQSDTGSAILTTRASFPDAAVPAARPLTAAGALRPASSWGRPDTGWQATGPRPGTASGYTHQLCSDPVLNDHPLLLEYLAKHVLMEGLAATGQVHIDTHTDSLAYSNK